MRTASILEDKIAAIADRCAAELGFEIVRVRVLGDRRPRVQIMAQRADGGFNVENCAKLSRAMSLPLEEMDPIPAGYTLEVSSPGIDRPLTRLQDFASFEGFEAKVELARMENGRKRFRGLLAGVDGEEIRLKQDDGEVFSWRFNQLQDARLVLTDELIAEDMRRAKERGEDQPEFEDADAGEDAVAEDE
ncbi:MAG: ribosome maturation factor RimP [Caulobacterales bacterium]